jgi:FKBP-type peptidyl-prolyl cis-trans isomerase
MTRLAFVWALAAAASLVAFAVPPAMAADDALSAEANQAFLAANAKKPGVHVLSNGTGLQYRIIQNGFGKRPGPTDTVVVYYTGSLINGKVFDGTSPGLPASLPVADVIPGWSQALQLMREGDHWQLVIPAMLGYGNRGAPDGSIPPNQTLVFDLRLISTTPAPRPGDKNYRPDPNDKDAEQQQ